MIEINGYFTDGCVIQADENFVVRGKTDPDAAITAKLCGKQNQIVNAVADHCGSFTLEFAPIKGGFSTYSLTFCVNGNKKTIENVLFGDVWIGAGQSNLELKLKYLADKSEVFREYSEGKFRFTDVPNVKSRYNGSGFFGLTEDDGELMPPVVWNTPENKNIDFETAGFSFIFAAEMQKKCDHPVAIVNLAVGGTNITHWLPENCFYDTPALSSCIKKCDGKSEAGSVFYEKICPMKGVAFKGVIWYLGESVAWTGHDTCAEYSTVLCRLIDLYRNILKGEVNFLLVDIGIEGYNEFSVSEVNEQNFITAKKRKNTVQCPIFDLSQNWLVPDGRELYHPIHLVEKTEHAKRAATLAHENFTAKRKLLCPEISFVSPEEDHVMAKISNCDEILSANGKELFGFAVAGKDEKFVPAKAEIVAKTEIKIYSPFVKKTAYMTYGFFLYNNLCNGAGKTNGLILPLLPYRGKCENPQGKYYEEFNPAFFGYECLFENSFGELGGGAWFKPAWKVSEIYGCKKAKLTFSHGSIHMRFGYSPENACVAGLCPELLRTNHPHYLDRYDFISIVVRAKTPLTLIGIHFKTCDGKQFFIAPRIKNEEHRCLGLPAGNAVRLDFDLSAGIDLREGSFTLTREERKKIALMQITFRGHEAINEVSVSDITCYYGAPANGQTTAPTENKDKLFNYGETDGQ